MNGKIKEEIQTKSERKIKIELGGLAKRKNFLVLTDKTIKISVKTESKNQWVEIINSFLKGNPNIGSFCPMNIPKNIKSKREETRAKKKM